MSAPPPIQTPSTSDEEEGIHEMIMDDDQLLEMEPMRDNNQLMSPPEQSQSSSFRFMSARERVNPVPFGFRSNPRRQGNQHREGQYAESGNAQPDIVTGGRLDDDEDEFMGAVSHSLMSGGSSSGKVLPLAHASFKNPFPDLFDDDEPESGAKQ